MLAPFLILSVGVLEVLSGFCGNLSTFRYEGHGYAAGDLQDSDGPPVPFGGYFEVEGLGEREDFGVLDEFPPLLETKIAY